MNNIDHSMRNLAARWLVASIPLILALAGCATLCRKDGGSTHQHTPWTEDPRMELLKAIVVGSLPEGKLDAPRLLAFVNTRVAQAGLPSYCKVVFQTDPEVLVSDYLWRDLCTPGYLSGMDLLEPIGLSPERDLRPQIESLNLKQLLWLVMRAYVMGVMYTEVGITMGYGFASHDVISPDAPTPEIDRQEASKMQLFDFDSIDDPMR